MRCCCASSCATPVVGCESYRSCRNAGGRDRSARPMRLRRGAARSWPFRFGRRQRRAHVAPALSGGRRTRADRPRRGAARHRRDGERRAGHADQGQLRYRRRWRARCTTRSSASVWKAACARAPRSIARCSRTTRFRSGSTTASRCAFSRSTRRPCANTATARDEFLKMTLLDIQPPEDAERLIAAIEAARGGGLVVHEWRHRRKNGSIFDVEINAQPLDFRGRPGAHRARARHHGAQARDPRARVERRALPQAVPAQPRAHLHARSRRRAAFGQSGGGARARLFGRRSARAAISPSSCRPTGATSSTRIMRTHEDARRRFGPAAGPRARRHAARLAIPQHARLAMPTSPTCSAMRRTSPSGAISSSKLRELSTIDPLTGCRNRRFLDEHTSQLGDASWGCILDRSRSLQADQRHLRPRARRSGADRHGRFSAQACAGRLVVVRMGGDEFLVLMDAADDEASSALARNLADARTCRSAVGFHARLRGAQAGEALEATIRRADEGLYAARAAARGGGARLRHSTLSNARGGRCDTCTRSPFCDVGVVVLHDGDVAAVVHVDARSATRSRNRDCSSRPDGRSRRRQLRRRPSRPCGRRPCRSCCRARRRRSRRSPCRRRRDSSLCLTCSTPTTVPQLPQRS